ncbi:MAG: virulence RhuM family protein [Luteolibacter sp.]
MSEESEPQSSIVLYQTEEGDTRIECRFDHDTLWLTQAQIAELFQTTPQNVTLHLKAIFAEGELAEDATCKEYLQVRKEGKREVSRSLRHYRLEAILAVGYRVRSTRGTQFRQWATARLSEYLVKGFVMDDERLKNPGGWDYFDELLARIRDIRASEKRFYQKVRDLFALSSDYQTREKEASLFFAEVQNKLLYAATRHTAAELIVDRADPGQPNMALTSWSGSRVRKQDVIIAKNYLTEDEVDTLNRLVVIFLEQAELRAKQQKELTLDYWRSSVDRMLASNDQPLLDGSGNVSHETMKAIAAERYESFDGERRSLEAREADAEDLKAIEDLEKDLKRKGGKA